MILLTLVLAMAGLLIIPGLYWEEHIRGRMAWRSYEKEAETRGVKLRFTDFLPGKVPDAENFAGIPVFQEAFRAGDSGKKYPNPFELPQSDGHSHPKFANHLKETPIDLTAWQTYFVQAKMVPRTSNNPAADVLTALEPFSAPLSELDEAAKRPYGRFPVHWEQHWTAATPHLDIILKAAELHSLRMAAHLASGESAAAYGDFQAGLRLSHGLREEPGLMADLVRSMAVVQMEEGVWSGLARHQWAMQELQKIEADLANCDLLHGYQSALSSERGAANDLYDMLARDPRLMVTLIHVEMPHRSKRGDVWFHFYPSGWHYQSRLRLNRFYDELLARVEPAKHRWFADRTTPSSPEQIREMGEKIRHMMFMIQAGGDPTMLMWESRFLLYATTSDQARIACALERFHLARGEYPPSLADLESALQLQLPHDILNGEPYHYRKRKNGGFVLYSVGTDLIDDGGINKPKESAYRQLDWVWQYPEQ
jgi:hypothetical protein